MGLKLRKWVGWPWTSKRTVQSTASDLGMIVGAAGVSFGCWLHYVPAGYIVGGLFVIALSYVLGGESVQRNRTTGS